MQIRKLKFTGDTILVRAEETVGDQDTVRRIELESGEPPRPELHDAKLSVLGPALRMIEAPAAWEQVAVFSGVSLTWEEDRGMGAVVTMLVPLPCAPSPLVINTPYLPSEDPNGSGGATLPGPLQQAIEQLIAEAQRYLDGARAQGDLFGGGDQEANSALETSADAGPEAGDQVAFDPTTGEVLDEPAPEQPAVAGPILDRSPDDQRAEFAALKRQAEVSAHRERSRSTGIRPARGRRQAKA